MKSETFLTAVVKDLLQSKINLTDVVFILPSRRARVRLIQDISTSLERPIFSPKIFSIEAFLEHITDLSSVSNISLLFKFYEVYKASDEESPLSFEQFEKWAQIVIQDFNEIDRHLIQHDSIFETLSSIKNIERWSPNQKPTAFIENYLGLWTVLKTYYKELVAQLLLNKEAHQGLLYREAANKIDAYIAKSTKTHVFIGFNALNAAEDHIFQSFLNSGKAKVYWDIDQSFLNRTFHSAGTFIRRYKNEWNYYKANPFKWVENNYEKQKNISIYGVPKIVGQLKHVGALLNKINSDTELQNTAVVLADESHLLPLLQSLPSKITSVNITMGFPLSSTHTSSLFKLIFKLQRNSIGGTYYYTTIVELLQHGHIQAISNNETKTVISHLQNNNITYLSLADLQLMPLNTKTAALLNLLLTPWNNNLRLAMHNIKALIIELKNAFINTQLPINKLHLEALYRFNLLFSEIEMLNANYNHLTTTKVFETVFNDLTQMETLDFEGDALNGLQIMGMLETRVLDFETVIITGVNEGVLPAGKSQNSFIPFDVKLVYNLPTYKDKDAVFTYHFYRLIQRATNVHIIYNTEIDTLKGGEPSRLLTQLEHEQIHTVSQFKIIPETKPQKALYRDVKKTAEVIQSLSAIAEKGLSPSSLSTYIRNPLDFYYKRVLGLKQFDAIEETVAANTLGNVVHQTLEDFYNPFVNSSLTTSKLTPLLKQISGAVKENFKRYFKDGDITKGKNLIVYEVAKQYVKNLINLDIDLLKKGNTIELMGIESNYKIPLNVPKLTATVFLKGKVDRIDRFNGTLRIIDYKTGATTQTDLTVADWDQLTKNYKHHKSFQVLCYALMLQHTNELQYPCQAGILSFKNLASGFLAFKEKGVGEFITEQTLITFKTQLNALIEELFNIDLSFIEKEV